MNDHNKRGDRFRFRENLKFPEIMKSAILQISIGIYIGYIMIVIFSEFTGGGVAVQGQEIGPAGHLPEALRNPKREKILASRYVAVDFDTWLEKRVPEVLQFNGTVEGFDAYGNVFGHHETTKNFMVKLTSEKFEWLKWTLFKADIHIQYSQWFHNPTGETLPGILNKTVYVNEEYGWRAGRTLKVGSSPLKLVIGVPCHFKRDPDLVATFELDGSIKEKLKNQKKGKLYEQTIRNKVISIPPRTSMKVDVEIYEAIANVPFVNYVRISGYVIVCMLDAIYAKIEATPAQVYCWGYPIFFFDGPNFPREGNNLQFIFTGLFSGKKYFNTSGWINEFELNPGRRQSGEYRPGKFRSKYPLFDLQDPLAMKEHLLPPEGVPGLEF